VSGLVLSLFPGIGLLDRAFEEEGFTVVRGPDQRAVKAALATPQTLTQEASIR